MFTYRLCYCAYPIIISFLLWHFQKYFGSPSYATMTMQESSNLIITRQSEKEQSNDDKFKS